MTTRTLNPLPFEHLEPKRFEDLVRALLYDFRSWSALEATGRSGGDEGFDAVGRERLESQYQPPSDQDGGALDESDIDGIQERIWLVQCKREKRIGPAAILKHFGAIPDESFESLHGVIYVAACNLSKKTRDAGRHFCAERGVSEVYFWGVSEIEDALRQPQNDHLLFAFFGISLQVRKRSLQAAIRRTTTIKRKIQKHLSNNEWPGTQFLLRDPEDSTYPNIADGSLPGVALAQSNYNWRACFAKGFGVFGLKVVVRCCPAFYDVETGFWDIASAGDRSLPFSARDIWPVEELSETVSSATGEWLNIVPASRSHMFIIAELPFDEIIEIDELGDSVWDGPTVFVRFMEGRPPIRRSAEIYFQTPNGWKYEFSSNKQIPVFKDEARDQDWESGWRKSNGFKIAEAVPENLIIFADDSDGDGVSV